MNELIQNLRALADKLEAANLPENCKPDVQLHFHGTNRREHLQAVVRLMDKARSDKRSGTHWVYGTICTFDAFAYYPAGLLSKVKKTTVVEVEECSDVSILFVEEPANV